MTMLPWEAARDIRQLIDENEDLAVEADFARNKELWDLLHLDTDENALYFENFKEMNAAMEALYKDTIRDLKGIAVYFPSTKKAILYSKEAYMKTLTSLYANGNEEIAKEYARTLTSADIDLVAAAAIDNIWQEYST